MGSLWDFYPDPRRYDDLIPKGTAEERLAGHWQRVGQYIAGAMQEVERMGIELEPVTVDQLAAARYAWRRFGKGNHAAGLNFGDCFAYALADVTREPLLFKGDDFARTDIRAA